MVISPSSIPDHEISDYRSWTLPTNVLLPFDSLWINSAGANPRPHRVLPSGEPSIAVRRIFDADGIISRCELVVCCQYTAGLWHRPPPGEELIAVRLKPEIAAAALAIDLVDYCDAAPLPIPRHMRSKMDDTWRLACEGAPKQQVAEVMFREVLSARSDVKHVSSFVHAASMLRECNGSIPIHRIAKTLQVSTRTLQRQFVDHLGVSPKFYSRRLRLTEAAILADRSECVIWADIAAACGFHDQAHLINEYQSLIGLTPTESHRERLGLD